jgi:hypothetical protein
VTRPTVFVTGDCQALDIAAAAVSVPQLNERCEFVHLNCSGYGEKVEQPTEDQVRRCVAHWRQNTESSPPAVDVLCAHQPRLTFPTVALGIYLPFQVFDPLRPANTWLGDRVLIAVDEKGVPADEIPETYYDLSCEMAPKLWRLGGAQIMLLRQAEQACDVKPSAFMSVEMYQRRLFWDFDHAAPPMIGWLLGELVRQAWPADRVLQRAVREQLTDPAFALPTHHPWQVPIARVVREQLDLDWIAPDALYEWHGKPISEDEYLKIYVADRRRIRAEATAP